MLTPSAIENPFRYPIKRHFIFKGERNNPLLAPRGVCLCEDVLVVSDTAQNRVLIWYHFSGDEYQTPDIILGQADASHAERNNGGPVSAGSLLYPSGVWTDGKKLIVSDAWNHRVLIWNTMPTKHGQAADTVVGQPDFTSNLPNQIGLSKPPTEKTLYWPYGVCSDGQHMWIADTGNRRVLFYNQIPDQNNVAADQVIGQVDFSERDYNNVNALWPYSVKLGERGQLCITDTQYYRVLLWKHWRDAFDQNAAVIVGQPDAESNGQNQYRLSPMANTLNWCYDSCFAGEKFLVADSGNSRILFWNQVPFENGAAADKLLGQQHFSVNGESSLSVKTKLENELYWPFSLAYFQNTLAVADTGNHRIIFYDL